MYGETRDADRIAGGLVHEVEAHHGLGVGEVEVAGDGDRRAAHADFARRLLAAAEEEGSITIGSKTYLVSITTQEVVYVDQSSTTATVTRKSIVIPAYAYTSLSGDYAELSATAVSTSTNPVNLTITYVTGEIDKDPYIEYSLNIGEYSAANNKAKLIANPNDFNREKDLAGCNDRSGIVPMNKAEETGIVPYVAPES